jgi:hypothetical protein
LYIFPEVAAYLMCTHMEGYPALAEIVPEKRDNDRKNLSEKVVDGADLHGEIEDAKGQCQTAHGDKREEEKLAKIIPACIPKIEVFVQEKVDRNTRLLPSRCTRDRRIR